jgi:hypothetical protein
LELNDHALQDAFNEIDMIRSRLASLETDTQQSVDAGVAPVHQDLQAIGALLSQVTEAVSDTDHRSDAGGQVKQLAHGAASPQGCHACAAKQAGDRTKLSPSRNRRWKKPREPSAEAGAEAQRSALEAIDEER